MQRAKRSLESASEPTSGDLVRTARNKMIGGVCGALANRFGVSTTLVRVAFVASMFLPGPQILLYLVLWALIPAEK